MLDWKTKTIGFLVSGFDAGARHIVLGSVDRRALCGSLHGGTRWGIEGFLDSSIDSLRLEPRQCVECLGRFERALVLSRVAYLGDATQAQLRKLTRPWLAEYRVGLVVEWLLEEGKIRPIGAQGFMIAPGGRTELEFATR